MTKPRLAIIGSGISGLTCAHYLQSQYQITLFEANDYVGGHTATKLIDDNGQPLAVDTGFIVFNDWTYPNFIRLMDSLGVESIETEMGFSVSCDETGLEYSGGSVATLFAQKRNLFKPRHWRMIRDILKFNDESKKRLEEGALDEEITLGQYIKELGLGQAFIDKYIIPMGAAIWSSGLQAMFDFPALYFIRFFKNHGLLNVNDRPQWRVIKNGSHSYVKALLEQANYEVRLNSPVSKVSKHEAQVAVHLSETTEVFDKVILACHSDQSAAMVRNDFEAAAAVLDQLPYAENDVVLHTDESLLPKRKSTWSSWNYRIRRGRDQQATLTYDMNILQRFDKATTYCVTLNDTDAIDPNKILGRWNYAHPVYNLGSLAGQAKRGSINGVDNLYYCGAYWYAGFHEDGVRSALDVVNMLGVELEIL